MKTLLLKIVQNILFKNGFSRHFAPVYAKYIVNDLLSKEYSLSNKIWAHRRGFRASKINYYGLNESNYKNYLPEHKYYQLHPINGHFSHWIDDKLTIRYLLEPFKQYLPQYYFHLYQGEVIKLPDCPSHLTASIDAIVSLLDEKKELGAKLLNASLGEGFNKLETKDGIYLVNNNIFSRDQFSKLVSKWKDQTNGGYLITEFLHPCKQFKLIWGKSSNTVRVTTLRNKNKAANIIDGFVRFGSEKTGYTDSAPEESIVCKLNIINGTFSDALIINHQKYKKHSNHPDTNALLEGVVPHWKSIQKIILEISNYFSHVIYMGFDMIVTDSGFKIIEINSHQGIGFNQIHKPYLQDELTKDFFTPLLERKKQELTLKKNSTIIGKLINYLKKVKYNGKLFFAR